MLNVQYIVCFRVEAQNVIIGYATKHWHLLLEHTINILKFYELLWISNLTF